MAKPHSQLHILVMGGTLFLGRHIVDAALQRGHRITLFNRGRQNPSLYPEVERLIGDRDTNLEALRGRRFDAIIDPSAYRPEQVQQLLETLGEPPRHYAYVSSISVYKAPLPHQTYNEDAERLSGEDGYGALKARTEDALRAALPKQHAVIRPGLIVGPFDPTDRFTYWVRRIDQGGNVLVPGRPGRSIQYVDARDLAAWIVLLAEQNQSGVFNAAGPAGPLSMDEWMAICQNVAGKQATFHWVPDATLETEGLTAWTELPFWVREDHPTHGGIFMADNRHALAHGLRFRPLQQTVADTLQWVREAGVVAASPIRVTPISAAREQEILQKYLA